MTHFEAVFRSAHGKGLAGGVIQWGALANVAQYRLPDEKTLAHLAAGDQVLDWGCGNGHFSYFLTQHGVRTVGLSFEDAPAALVGEPLFQHVRHDDPVGLPFSDARFDAAVSVGVLEHVHETGGDQRASLVELARVLKPGGHAACLSSPEHVFLDRVPCPAGQSMAAETGLPAQPALHAEQRRAAPAARPLDRQMRPLQHHPA